MAACCQILEARRHFKDASSTQELQTQQELPSVSWRKRRLIRAVMRENGRQKKSVAASDARPSRISRTFAESSVSAMRAQILRIGYCFVNLESRASQPGESTASLDQSPMSKKSPMARAPQRWASQRRFRKRYLALSVFPDYQRPW